MKRHIKRLSMLSPTAPVQTVTVINFMRGTNCFQISALILSHLKEIFWWSALELKPTPKHNMKPSRANPLKEPWAFWHIVLYVNYREIKVVSRWYNTNCSNIKYTNLICIISWQLKYFSLNIFCIVSVELELVTEALIMTVLPLTAKTV